MLSILLLLRISRPENLQFMLVQSLAPGMKRAFANFGTQLKSVVYNIPVDFSNATHSPKWLLFMHKLFSLDYTHTANIFD